LWALEVEAAPGDGGGGSGGGGGGKLTALIEAQLRAHHTFCIASGQSSDPVLGPVDKMYLYAEHLELRCVFVAELVVCCSEAGDTAGASRKVSATFRAKNPALLKTWAFYVETILRSCVRGVGLKPKGTT
jgi:hypothetical protein